MLTLFIGTMIEKEGLAGKFSSIVKAIRCDETMILEEAETHLKDVRMPAFYWRYQQEILRMSTRATNMRLRPDGAELTQQISSSPRLRLADRVAKMHNIDIADRLRALLSQTTKERPH